ncbi:hypothetical protein ACZ90_56140 [Streptomyces albus subsp. albus]|nr:hypothetical protein ACZ90_56140 [Streptomyces albus subsp. albus]
MTEYDRGPGSQPWHPEDPLYGDPGWQGQQAGVGHDPYAQDPLGQQSYAQPQHGHQPYGAQQPGQQSYEQYPHQGHQGHQAQAAHGQQPQDPYGAGHPGQPYPEAYPQQGGPQQGHPQWQGGPAGHPEPQAQYGSGGWEPGYSGLDPTDPYAQPADPYTGGQPDYYATENAYPPPEPSYARHEGAAPTPPHGVHQAAEPALAGAPGVGLGAPAGGEAGLVGTEAPGTVLPEEPDEAADFPEEGDAGDGGREPRGKKPKRRNGMACLVVAVVLVGLTGGAGYYGYQFWQSHFGAPPDYSGEGTGQVTIEVPKGAVVADIGNILKREGVVKSTDAFIRAAGKDDRGRRIQPGSYTMRQHMSAEAAVTMMTDPASMNALVVSEGMRNTAVYAAIDKKLGLTKGTTAGVAKREAEKLGLPDWADDNPKIRDPLEGFLFPGRYSAAKDAKPAAVLREMVKNATTQYAKYDLAGKARELGLDSPLQLVTVASLVQAEGVTHDDFRKMAEVVYNRLKPNNPQTFGKLQFDSTYNYAKNQYKIDIPISEIKNYDHPYNTYFYRGLPPGPIGNPGDVALKAAQNPTHDGWYYFISLDGKTTKFTKNYADHKKLVNEFNKNQQGN